MEVEAFLADSVDNVGGKLYVLGAGWNQINTQALPFRQARIGVGIIFRVPYTATNQVHNFQIYLRDADGQEMPLGDAPPGMETSDGKIRRLGGQFNIGRPPTVKPGDEQLVAVAINLDQLEFSRAESYSFVIELDGTEVKQLPFRVNQAVQPVPIVS
jgi:hypothetical protein